MLDGKLYVLVNGDFWFPAGTTISIASKTNIGFLSIQEINSSDLKCYLITSPTIVPNGKRWKISSVLPSQNFVGRKDFVIKIDGNPVFVGVSENFYIGRAFGSINFDLIKGDFWLPEGTTIEPSTNIYGISVIEY